MKHYKLSEIVVEVSERVNNPATSGYSKFVGLEHYVSGDVEITQYGSTEKLESAMKVFHSGDILIARRNVYLRRASVVFFDGLTSGDSIVLRAKDERIARLLPFVFNTDEFWVFADTHADGTMSKRLSPKILMQYEFDLPDEDEQEALANLLWTANDVRNKYRDLLIQTDELVKSQFIEMFGDPIDNTLKLPIHQLSDHMKHLTSGSRGWAKYYSDTGEWFITIKNVKDCKISIDDVQCVTPPQGAEADRTRLKEGDLLISVTADLGRTGVVSKEIAEHGAYINQHLTCIRLDPAILDPLYVAYFMESEAGKKQFYEKNLSSVKAGLNFDSIRTLKLMVPALQEQKRFVSFIEQVDKSKFELKQSIERVTELMKSLMLQG